MIKAIIFDCFGVLTQDGWLAFVHKYVKENDLAKAHDLNHQNNLGIISYREFLDQICQLTNVTQDVADNMIRRNLTADVKVFEIIQELKKSYKIGLLSNISANYLEELFSKQQLELFDALSLSFETGKVKPTPEAYDDICLKLKVVPEEAVFIDDREGYVRGSQQFGMPAIWYKNPHQLVVELAKHDIKISA